MVLWVQAHELLVIYCIVGVLLRILVLRNHSILLAWWPLYNIYILSLYGQFIGESIHLVFLIARRQGISHAIISLLHAYMFSDYFFLFFNFVLYYVNFLLLQ